MNRKQLIVILVAGVVLGAVGLMLWNKNRTEWEPPKRELVMPAFPINDIAQIHFRAGTNDLTVARKDDRWVVSERANFPASFSEITDFLRKLADLKPSEFIEVSASQLGRFELLEPGKGTNTATKVEFKDKSGKVLTTLMLGKKHMKKSPSTSPFGGGEWPDGRYLMIGSDLKTVCLVKETFPNAEPKAESWLDKEFFKIEKLKSVSLVWTNATNSWKMTRETETGEWKLADAGKDETIDTVKASSAASAMMNPSFADVVTRDTKPEVTGLDKPITATLETFDHFVYTLKFGKATSDGNNYYLSFNVEFNYPKERTPGKDEKPEDKEKLDKEYKENLKKLGEKFNKEKALEKWDYQVSKWSVESLMKPRHEMLAPKKEEPKPEEKKEGAATTTPAPTDSKPAEKK